MGFRAGSLAVVAAVILYSSAAAANRKFPGILAERLHMPCAPTCLVCHDSENGGLNTLRTITVNGQQLPGFGKHIKSACPVDGLNENSLLDDSVWACVVDVSQMSDLDGDGVPDLQELTIGQDPNDPADHPLCTDQPAYGCAPDRVARGGPIDDVGGVAAAAVALAGLSVFRRRR
jgi:hypothetical protein